MPTITTVDGTEYQVGPEDYEYVSLHRWYRYKESGYAYRRVHKESRKGTTTSAVLLHREIARAKRGQIVRFLDKDPTNCTRENLEVLTHTEAAHKRARPRGGSSPYLGVSWNKRRKCWQAVIRINGTLKWLGDFPAGEEGEKNAAYAYDAKALEVRGANARLNFPAEPRRKRRTVRPRSHPRPTAVSRPKAESQGVEALFRKRPDELTPDELQRMKRHFLGQAS